MKLRMVISSVMVTGLTAGLCSAGDSPDQKREKIRKMANETLNELYKEQPAARGAIQASVGYAVFANLGTKILLVSTAHGSGVAVNSKTKNETFMKMFSAGGGLGVGVKDYRVIFAFENDAAMARFWIRVGKVRPKPTPQPKRKRAGEHIPEQPTLTKVYGPTRSRRRVLPSTPRYRARSTPRTTTSTTPKRSSCAFNSGWLTNLS